MFQGFIMRSMVIKISLKVRPKQRYENISDFSDYNRRMHKLCWLQHENKNIGYLAVFSSTTF